jgi:hypothetical protein
MAPRLHRPPSNQICSQTAAPLINSVAGPGQKLPCPIHSPSFWRMGGIRRSPTGPFMRSDRSATNGFEWAERPVSRRENTRIAQGETLGWHSKSTRRPGGPARDSTGRNSESLLRPPLPQTSVILLSCPSRPHVAVLTLASAAADARGENDEHSNQIRHLRLARHCGR